MYILKVWVTGVLLLSILSGCGGNSSEFKADTFSIKDMCAKQIESKMQVCYGDKRSDAEKLLGAEESTEKLSNATVYQSGIFIYYRNDVVAGFALLSGSEGVYETARGAQVGMNKQVMKALYGDNSATEVSERNLDYAYDSVNNKFLEQSITQ